MTISILLVENHTVVRKGLPTFLSYDLEVVGEAAGGIQELTRVGELKPEWLASEISDEPFPCTD